MKFKDKILVLQFETAPPVLKAIASDLDDFVKENYGKELTVTRILDPVDGESGVHLTHRAIDFRNEFANELTFTPAETKDLLDYCNVKYTRHDKYPTLLSHKFLGTDGSWGPLHFHLQISQRMAEENKIS